MPFNAKILGDESESSSSGTSDDSSNSSGESILNFQLNAILTPYTGSSDSDAFEVLPQKKSYFTINLLNIQFRRILERVMMRPRVMARARAVIKKTKKELKWMIMMMGKLLEGDWEQGSHINKTFRGTMYLLVTQMPSMSIFAPLALNASSPLIVSLFGWVF